MAFRSGGGAVSLNGEYVMCFLSKYRRSSLRFVEGGQGGERKWVIGSYVERVINPFVYSIKRRYACLGDMYKCNMLRSASTLQDLFGRTLSFFSFCFIFHHNAWFQSGMRRNSTNALSTSVFVLRVVRWTETGESCQCSSCNARQIKRLFT
jgi:hypothetical protein